MAQMSGTRAEAFNQLLWPVAAAAGTSLCVPRLPLAGELACLYAATALVTAGHIHYAVCLLIQLTEAIIYLRALGTQLGRQPALRSRQIRKGHVHY